MYQRIMDDVIDSCQVTFEEEGVNHQTLDDLRKVGAFRCALYLLSHKCSATECRLLAVIVIIMIAFTTQDFFTRFCFVFGFWFLVLRNLRCGGEQTHSFPK